MRKIIYSDSLGVYLGSCFGAGFWAKLESLGQTVAVTFADEEEIRAVIAEWECLAFLPSDLHYLDVESDAEGFASIAACVAAGAEAWDPNAVRATQPSLT
jgi:hypothetical protein